MRFRVLALPVLAVALNVVIFSEAHTMSSDYIKLTNKASVDSHNEDLRQEETRREEKIAEKSRLTSKQEEAEKERLENKVLKNMSKEKLNELRKQRKEGEARAEMKTLMEEKRMKKKYLFKTDDEMSTELKSFKKENHHKKKQFKSHFFHKEDATLLKHGQPYMKEGRTLKEKRDLKKLRLRIKRQTLDGAEDASTTRTKSFLPKMAARKHKNTLHGSKYSEEDDDHWSNEKFMVKDGDDLDVPNLSLPSFEYNEIGSSEDLPLEEDIVDVAPPLDEHVNEINPVASGDPLLSGVPETDVLPAENEVFPPLDVAENEFPPFSDVAENEILPSPEVAVNEVPPFSDVAENEILPSPEVAVNEFLPFSDVAENEILPSPEVAVNEIPLFSDVTEDEILSSPVEPVNEILPSPEVAVNEILPFSDVAENEILPSPVEAVNEIFPSPEVAESEIPILTNSEDANHQITTTSSEILENDIVSAIISPVSVSERPTSSLVDSLVPYEEPSAPSGLPVAPVHVVTLPAVVLTTPGSVYAYTTRLATATTKPTTTRAPWPWASSNLNPDECGQARFGPENRAYRGRRGLKILEGKEAIPGSFPWQVAILDKDRDLLCGGTLIAPRWVVTAAHCIRKKLYVRLSEHHMKEKDGHEVEQKVRRIYRHPGFNTSSIDNDIALLRLPAPPAFPNQETGVVSPGVTDSACLPSDDQDFPPVGTRCLVMGWGKASATHGYGTDVLMYTRLPIISHKACVRANRKTITENMFCAGHYKGGSDTCSGDSGGPLLCSIGADVGEETWTMYGVTSFGDGCGNAGKMGVYTKVNKYLQWMADIMSRY